MIFKKKQPENKKKIASDIIDAAGGKDLSTKRIKKIKRYNILQKLGQGNTGIKRPRNDGLCHIFFHGYDVASFRLKYFGMRQRHTHEKRCGINRRFSGA